MAVEWNAAGWNADFYDFHDEIRWVVGENTNNGADSCFNGG